jgi:hypothetical protein
VTEAVVNAAEAAGDNVRGFDDEALNSAGCAVIEVIDTAGEAMRDRIVAIMRRRIPAPTVALFSLRACRALRVTISTLRGCEAASFSREANRREWRSSSASISSPASACANVLRGPDVTPFRRFLDGEFILRNAEGI